MYNLAIFVYFCTNNWREDPVCEQPKQFAVDECQAQGTKNRNLFLRDSFNYQ